MSKPFRWDLSRREQLGRLIDGDKAPVYDEFIDDVRTCAVKTLARCRDSDLLFVGRSPDSIFDYLSGALADTSWISRLALVNLSLRGQDLAEIRRKYPQRLRALHDHFAALGIDPNSLSRRRSITFVDLVSSGATFADLAEVMLNWTRDRRVDINAVVRNIRFIGITWRTKTSPNTFRWQQHASWLSDFPSGAVKNVSIPGRLWDYLGNRQAKVALSNPPWRWGTQKTLRPPRYAENLEALRLALHIYDPGTSPEEREKLAAGLASTREMRHPWLRALVAELRRVAA